MDALAWIIAATLIVLMIRLRVFGHREFGLIRQFACRHAGNLAQSLFLQKPSRAYRIDSRHSARAETAEKKSEAASPRSEETSAESESADRRKAA
jgi:hypothetical protein